MKKSVFAFALMVAFPVLAAEDSSVMKDGVKSVVSGVISAGKDAISGVKDGVDDGRQSGSSIDGALIISDKENLAKYVSASVSSVEKVGDEEYKLTIGLRNNSDKIVRLTNLHESKSLILLDKEGFISGLKSPLMPTESDITIPENAATRVRYVFSQVEDTPATLRIYGMDIPVPAVKAQ